MPLGSGCIFTLPPKKGGGPLLAFNTISGTSQVAACYVFTTGPTTTAGMAIPSSPAWPQSAANRLRYSFVTLMIGICAVLFGFSRQKPQRRLLYATTAVLGLVCISVSLLGGCTGFSPANSAPAPAAQVTPAATYRLLIQATPAPGNGGGFTQSQLIVPFTVN